VKASLHAPRSTIGEVTGLLALLGGGPFVANDELDRRLLNAVGAQRVVVLPTADAYEHPDRMVATAQDWGRRVGVAVEGLMVLNRPGALDADHVATVAGARAVYLAGDSPMHLRSVLKETPLWKALNTVLAEGGLVAAVGASAAAICDPMVDPRGGAFTLGLGMVSGLALVTELESWSADRLHRTLKLANTPIALLHTGSALVHSDTGWELVGGPDIRGELPPR
jgi:cyanophycinase